MSFQAKNNIFNKAFAVSVLGSYNKNNINNNDIHYLFNTFQNSVAKCFTRQQKVQQYRIKLKHRTDTKP